MTILHFKARIECISAISACVISLKHAQTKLRQSSKGFGLQTE